MERGFIATSLVYSFFLAFISVIAILLSNYIANKTILDRFNSKVQEELNTNSYVVTVYSRNANVKDGMAMTNLISNGDFSQNLEFWNIYGDAQYTTTLWLDNYSVLKSNNNVSNSYLYQNVYVMKNNLYYVTLNYLHDVDTRLYAYLGDKSENSFVIRDNQGMTWTRGSVAYRALFDGNSQFILGDSGSSSYAGNSYFTNAMILNLTASFGSGYEPDISWVDENISWFNGTISYFRQDEIEYGKDISIEFIPYSGYNNYTINCVDDEGNMFSNYQMSEADNSVEASDEGEDGSSTTDTRVNRVLNIREITSNVKCNVEWVYNE